MYQTPPNPENPRFSISFILLISGILFKLGVVPFHSWIPDVYSGAARISAVIFIILPKLTLFAILTRFLLILPTQHEALGPLILVLAIFTILLGAASGIIQISVMRILGYSAIANIGFILLPISLGTIAGIHSGIFYTLIYLIQALALSLLPSIFIFRDTYFIESVFDLRYIGTISPGLSIAFVLTILANMGLPPFPGFFAKFYLVTVLLAAEAILPLLIVLLATAITAYMYFRIMRFLAFDTIYAFRLQYSISSIGLLSLGFLTMSNFLFLLTQPVIFKLSLLILEDVI